MSSSLPRQKLHGWLFTPIPKPRLDGKKKAGWLSLEVTLDTTGLIYHLGSRELNHPQKEGHFYAELPGTLLGFISDFSLGTFSCIRFLHISRRATSNLPISARAVCFHATVAGNRPFKGRGLLDRSMHATHAHCKPARIFPSAPVIPLEVQDH